MTEERGSERTPRQGGARAVAVLIVFLLFHLAPAWSQVASLDYPGWRGRLRDGSASGFQPPAVWPERLTRRWSTSVGEGYATPIVVGERVFMLARRGDTESLVALSAATGHVLWQTGYPAAFSPQYNARAHGLGPKATPLYYEGRVFTLGINGTVTAFDATTGSIVWQKPAASAHPMYGAAASPLAHQGLVMVHPGNYGPLTAYDANTGAVKWRAGGDGAFASPVLADVGGLQHVVTVTQDSIAGISLEGKVLWTFRWPRDISAITPVVYGDLVIVGSQNERVAAVKLTRRGEGVRAEPAWESREIQLYIANPIIVGDVLFGVSRRSGGQLFAVEARSGMVRWLGSPRQLSHAALAKADNLVFLLTEGGDLAVGTVSASGFEIVKRYKVADGGTWAQPAISGRRIFIKDASSVTLWTVD